MFDPSAGFAELDLAPLAELPEALTCEALYRADRLTSALARRRALEVWTALGLERDDAGEEPAERAGVVEAMRPAFALLQALVADAGEPPTLAELAPALSSDGSRLGSTEALLAHVAEGMPAVLTGEQDARRLLFAGRALQLWGDYFSPANIGYDAVNQLVAIAARRRLPERPLRVLEVGGGLGSGARALLPALPAGSRYHFSDKSALLLRRGAAALEDDLPSLAPGVTLTTGALDLDTLPEATERYDLIVAVNVLHAARDLGATLAGLRDRLEPGGALLAGEAVRPAPERPLPIELCFLLMPEVGEIVPAPYRPTGGFVAGDAWPQALAAAGLGCEGWPDLGSARGVYPDYSLQALWAVRP